MLLAGINEILALSSGMAASFVVCHHIIIVRGFAY
jgi:hypothetical protein